MSFLAERKCIGLSARIKKPYLKIALRDCTLLPDQLIDPLSGYGAHAIVVYVRSIARTRRGAVDCNLESDVLAVRSRAQNEVKVARTESVDDAAALLLKCRVLVVDRPLAGKAPFVQS